MGRRDEADRRPADATPIAIVSPPPVPLTSLVGRTRELADLEELVAARRLVTLTGVGGSGKTRLATELALRLEHAQPGSVAWVELGRCMDAGLVAQQVGAALSLRAMQGGDLVPALVAALRDRQLLLVLDDCEHLVDAVAEVAGALLQRCPSLRIVATSREPLGVGGERIWPVPPVTAEEGARLFAERAGAVDPTFALGTGNAASIAEICRRLDGIPLAIELAAARARVLTVEQIAARLEDRFALLTGGARTAVARHRTLRAAIDWSFSLLQEREQALLARLAVFPACFSLESVEAICGGDLDVDLDLLTGLVDKSLVATTVRGGSVRYALLQTIRQYASERLAERGEALELGRRHALAFLDFARAAKVDPMGDVMHRLEEMATDHDNVRAALSWGLEHEPDTVALPLAAAYRWFWYYRILWSEGLRWTTLVLERATATLSPERTSVLTAAGSYAGYTGDLATGRRRLEEAEAMWRALGDDRELALALSGLAVFLAGMGELDAAARRADEALASARTKGSRWDVAYCLAGSTAYVAERRGALAEADRAYGEAETIFGSLDNTFGLPFVLSLRALLAVRRGDLEAAARGARAALVESRSLRYLWFAARALRVLAFASGDDLPRAARLLGAADATLRTVGATMMQHERVEHERLMETLRGALSAEELEAALREGRSMSFEEACDFALQSAAAARAAQHDAEPARPAICASGPALVVDDLGPLVITLGGQPIAQEGRAATRVRELLAFLLAHPAGATKEEVGVAFWPNAASVQVKNAFHVTLHRLRRLLGGAESVAAEGGRYRVTIPFLLVSQRFESEVSAALRDGDAAHVDAARLDAALALYRGDYLQGEDVGEWSLPMRTRLREVCLRGLCALGRAHETRGRYADAADAYGRALSREPFHEGAARQLMICRARLGARSEALLVFRQLEQRLREDLAAAPEPETSALFRRLRQNEAV